MQSTSKLWEQHKDMLDIDQPVTEHIYYVEMMYHYYSLIVDSPAVFQ